MTENPSQTLIMADDFMTIAFPPDLPGEFGRLNTRENILALARHFWRSSARTAGVPDLSMEIQDFLAWVNRHVVLQPGVESYPVTGGDKDAFNPLTERPAPGGMDNMKKNMLTVWAQNFFNRLKDTERKIFFYYDCEGLTHKAVSDLMKKKATLFYQRDKIREKLKSFLMNLNWVSPEYDTNGQDSREFEFFILSLCDNLGTWVNSVETV
jgi:DNA-directed RNA polymerase specialized sigma24 family protein